MLKWLSEASWKPFWRPTWPPKASFSRAPADTFGVFLRDLAPAWASSCNSCFLLLYMHHLQYSPLSVSACPGFEVPGCNLKLLEKVLFSRALPDLHFSGFGGQHGPEKPRFWEPRGTKFEYVRAASLNIREKCRICTSPTRNPLFCILSTYKKL